MIWLSVVEVVVEVLAKAVLGKGRGDLAVCAPVEEPWELSDAENRGEDDDACIPEAPTKVA